MDNELYLAKTYNELRSTLNAKVICESTDSIL